ncbi:trypsin-like peptidase domain-containing protein [Streptomyces avermitilis]|uniref:nSTAND1 domain-containing NTPase n=1 Tax=Streptomyces avermitilis TaxID=33903 RepID=UPI00380C29DE
MPASVVQVLAEDGAVAGAGFLAAPDTVLTCAHVVHAAGQGMGGQIHLVFPHLPGAPQAVAGVLSDGWRHPDGEDIAVLRVENTPADARELALGSAAGLRGRRVLSFGFPAQAPAAGHFGYATAGDLLPLEGNRSTGVLLQLADANDLTRGFSGGPVVDEVTGLVVGMVTAVTAPDGYLKGLGIAYATPAELLREVWPELGERQVCPYRGLEPFTAEHAVWFCGREAAVQEMLAALTRQPRVLLLLGPSGAGKSSLVQAGLLPALAHGGLPGSDRWLPLLTRPGHDLLAELERSGLSAAMSEGLVSAVRRLLIAEPAVQRVMLVVDQFEELLTRPGLALRPPAEADAVVEQLVAAIGSSVPLTVVLVMRDDFYPRLAALAPHLLKAAAHGLLNVPATLSHSDLHAIITEPAHAAGARLEDGLAERIAVDVLAADPNGPLTRQAPITVLPLLELALSQLWEQRRHGVLTHRAYQRIGQVTGSLANWCGTAFGQLSEQHHPTARRILTALVQPADETGNTPAARRHVPLSDLRALSAAPASDCSPTHPFDQVFDEVLATLARYRIITTRTTPQSNNTPGRPTAELVHDALIRDWSDLRTWVAEDHRFHVWLNRANQQRHRFAESGDSGDLLDGTDLAEGLDWATQRGLPADVAEFVAASRHRQQAAIRRARRLNVALVGMLVLALAAAGLFAWQRQTAVTAQHLSQSRQLVAQSAAMMDSDPELASLLAVNAYRISPTSEAARNLYTAAAQPLRHVFNSSHDSRLFSMAFSPDRRTLAAIGAESSHHLTVWLWDTRTGKTRSVTRYVGELGLHGWLVFSPDGRTLATASPAVKGHRAEVRLWDAATGVLRSTVDGPDNGAYPMAFSPDSTTLAVAYNKSGKVRLWDTARGKLRRTFDNPEAAGAQRPLEFSSDGTILAVASDRGRTVRLWNIPTGRLHGTLTLTTVWDAVDVMAFSATTHVLILVSKWGKVGLWDTGTDKTRTLSVPGEMASWIKFSPDRRTFALGASGSVRLIDAATGRLRGVLPRSDDALDEASVAFSPDSATLAVNSGGGAVLLWDIASSATRAVFRNRDGNVDDVSFSPDGTLLAVGNVWGVRVWDVAAGKSGNVLSGHLGVVSKAAFTADGTFLVTSGGDFRVRLWNLTTGEFRRLPTARLAGMDLAALSPDGTTLALMSDGGALQLWDIGTGKLRQSITLSTKDSFGSLTFASDGVTLVGPGFGAPGDEVRMRNIQTGETRRFRIEGTGGAEVSSLEFSPDGSSLAVASSRGAVSLRDAVSGEIRRTVTTEKDPANAVTFSPDGATLALAKQGGVRLYDIATGTFRPLRGGDGRDSVSFHGSVIRLVFSPDGKTLAGGGSEGGEGKVWLWDIPTANLRHTLTDFSADVTSLAFSHNSRTLAAGNGKGDVHLWDVPLLAPAEAISQICRTLHRDLTDTEKQLYLPDPESVRTCSP